jgi:hypothetical protein
MTKFGPVIAVGDIGLQNFNLGIEHLRNYLEAEVGFSGVDAADN